MRPQFLFSTLAVLLLPLPAIAQSQRYPTDMEIEGLVQDLRQDIPNLMEMGFYSDRRSSIDRQQRDALVQDWSDVDEASAPFLGDWAAIEESLVIFPTPTQGEVCIIDSYLDETDFYFGRVVDGKIYTDTNLTFVLDSGFLVSTFVIEDQAGRYAYANPRPFDNPATSSYYAEYHPDIADQFQRAGCLTELPETELPETELQE